MASPIKMATVKMATVKMATVKMAIATPPLPKMVSKMVFLT
jgi:hypothetical protein